MKRFFLFSLSCLMLAVSCVLFVHAFNKEAVAQSSGSYFKVLGSQGTCVYVAVGNSVYNIDANQGSHWYPVNSLPPVPVSSLVFYNYITAITESGEGWRNGGPWESVGVIPGGTVNVQSETWSGVKEKYRK